MDDSYKTRHTKWEYKDTRGAMHLVDKFNTASF